MGRRQAIHIHVVEISGVEKDENESLVFKHNVDCLVDDGVSTGSMFG